MTPAFSVFPKIDAHFHAYTFEPAYIKIAQENKLHYININTDTDIFPQMEEQETLALQYIAQYPDHFSFIGSFTMKNWSEEGWIEKTIERIKRSREYGALGIKIWKNIGMEIIKADRTYLMVDDPFFYPVFEYLSTHKIPVTGHLGEPLNCWLPTEQMTTKRNKAYFAAYPQFHAWLHPEIPSYQKQIDARDHILKQFPELIFVGAHFGSMEWSYKEIAFRFDQYPNFLVDLSSRLGHLQLQALDKYEEIRNFFIQYADRIIYGTDAYNNPDKLRYSLINDWKYLATYEMCTSNEIDGTFRGLQLPEEILFKIYYGNASNVYQRLAV